MRQLELLARLAHPAASKIVLLVLDGVGDLRTADQQRTALEVAVTPNLDALAARSALGRIVPVATGITPGSGPGHLALFGYDPTTSEADIGRGILEALGLGLELKRGEVAARGNFATADGEGRLTDRRAGRIPTDECRRLVDSLNSALAGMQRAEVRVAAGEAHRFVLLVSGEGLSAEIADTDPQELGVPPLSPRALVPAAHQTAAILHEAIERMERAISNEPKANRVLLRGFSQMPSLRPLSELYQLRCAAFAGFLPAAVPF